MLHADVYFQGLMGALSAEAAALGRTQEAKLKQTEYEIALMLKRHRPDAAINETDNSDDVFIREAITHAAQHPETSGETIAGIRRFLSALPSATGIGSGAAKRKLEASGMD